MNETTMTLIDLFGMTVALTSISLAAYLVSMDKRRYDRTFIVSLYLIGVILLVVTMEINKDAEVRAMLPWLLAYAAIAYWVAVVAWKSYRGELEPVVKKTKELLPSEHEKE